MENILKTAFILALLFGSNSIFGQTQNIDYTLLSKNVTYLGQDMEISSTITKTENVLTWTQINNGFSETSSFTISESSGSWDQDSSLGSITHNMLTDGYQCELILTGQENDLSVNLIYKINGIIEAQYNFDINAIIYQ